MPCFIVAERVGFEPTSPVKGLRFSRPVHSTALPPLRRAHSKRLRPLATLRRSPALTARPAMSHPVRFARRADLFVRAGPCDPPGFLARTGAAMRIIVVALALFALPCSSAWAQVAAKPAALEADGIPDVPAELAARTRPYLEYRTATFMSWHPTDHSMLITTRFGNTNQVHRVARPDGARVQLTFEEDPIALASYAPKTGDATIVQKDVGGDEFFQLDRLNSGRLELLSDGKSRNEFGSWNRDGTLVGYSSTRRNGTDTDLYLVNPRDAKSDRRIAECK